jgi:hypothetical protein
MTYWRMQLHPDHGAMAVKYTVESLAAGFKGPNDHLRPEQIEYFSAIAQAAGQPIELPRFRESNVCAA